MRAVERPHAVVGSPDTTRLHDRARDYEDHLRNFAMREGEVMNPYFTDTTYATVASYAGSADSASWTGPALASESWRYLVTGEPDSLATLTALHRGFNISPGDVGYLARVTLSSAQLHALPAVTSIVGRARSRAAARGARRARAPAAHRDAC